LGVKGFAPKHSRSLIKAINEVAKGNTYFENEYLPTRNTTKHNEVEIDGREIAIINKIVEGKDSKTLANELGGIADNTVDTYIKNLLARFECKNRAQLIGLAFVYRLIYTFGSFNQNQRKRY
jgi:DNA-binding NarL/FixJ family response regulator